MRQNDKILRFLTVRTDEDLKRAAPRQAGRGAEDRWLYEDGRGGRRDPGGRCRRDVRRRRDGEEEA